MPMDTSLKQRLVGAVVLVALAVIFLPMLVKGPAPDSGVSDVALDVPAEPKPAGDGMVRPSTCRWLRPRAPRKAARPACPTPPRRARSRPGCAQPRGRRIPGHSRR
jgi:cell division septation protein DedD